MDRFELLPLLLSIAAGVVGLELVWLYTAFRSRSATVGSSDARPLERFDPTIHGPKPHVAALIVTTNAEERIGHAIHGLLAQTVRPDLIVVTADKCTDETVAAVRSIARFNPQVAVIETLNNSRGPAGALNQGWSEIAPFAEVVLQIGDDAVLADDAIEQVLVEFGRAPQLAAVTASRRVQGLGSHRDGVGWWLRLLCRLQRVDAELANSAGREDRGRPQVLRAELTAFRNWALRDVDQHHDYWGPWSSTASQANIALTLDFAECRLPLLLSQNVWVQTKPLASLRHLWDANIQHHRAVAEALQGRRASSIARRLRWQQVLAGLGVIRCFALVILAILSISSAAGIGSSGIGLSTSRTATYALVVALLAFASSYRLKRRPMLTSSDLVAAGVLVPVELTGLLRSPGFIASRLPASRLTASHSRVSDETPNIDMARVR